MRECMGVPDYVYVDLVKPQRAPITGHDKFQGLTGIATFDMKVTSEYLFVGDGRQGYCDIYREAYYRFFRSKGQFVVPGTTLKGVVRSFAEAVSASCVSARSRRDRNVSELQRYPECKVKEDTRQIGLCPACRIFGTTGYRGHVSFSDALPNGDIIAQILKIAELWEPKRLIPKRKFYKSGQFVKLEDQSPEKNYRYIEAVPKNSVFTFDLFFENAREADLSLVWHSMGIGQGFEIKVGGAKPRCLGNVSFAVREIRIMEQLAIKRVENPEDFIHGILAHKDVINTKRLEELITKISSKDSCTGRSDRWN